MRGTASAWPSSRTRRPTCVSPPSRSRLSARPFTSSSPTAGSARVPRRSSRPRLRGPCSPARRLPLAARVRRAVRVGLPPGGRPSPAGRATRGPAGRRSRGPPAVPADSVRLPAPVGAHLPGGVPVARAAGPRPDRRAGPDARPGAPARGARGARDGGLLAAAHAGLAGRGRHRAVRPLLRRSGGGAAGPSWASPRDRSSPSAGSSTSRSSTSGRTSCPSSGTCSSSRPGFLALLLAPLGARPAAAPGGRARSARGRGLAAAPAPVQADVRLRPHEAHLGRPHLARRERPHLPLLDAAAPHAPRLVREPPAAARSRPSPAP